MQKITTFLTYNDQAEEAVYLYTSIFKDSEILSMSRYPEGSPFLPGAVMSVTFRIEGQEFMALNGGPSFSFAEGISLYVNCETQEEVDDLWERLPEGGEGGRCGWRRDRFGVSWQIIPSALGRYLGDEDPRKSQNVLQAMLQMGKINISALREAHEGVEKV